MHFSRLRLTGFKSFVEPSELYIEPGMTGIVGPNGCGKSNLVEALRWVMGETSPKSMRGGGMEDVIFAGTQTRPPRNFAEVSLLLDNSGRTAPNTFNNYNEVEVTRHIEREQGSSYSINSNEVRARDVQLLFADMVTGAHSSALVSQGQIGIMIQAKPVERRSLLEEAAGITGLHSRRHEAELKLRAAESNLEKLTNHSNTLDSQLRGLKRQVRQASRYSNLSGLIRSTEALLFIRLWEDSENEVHESVSILHKIEREEALSAETRSQAYRVQLGIEEKIPSLRDLEASSAAKFQRLIMERENLESEVSRSQDDIDRFKALLAQTEIDQLREKSLIQDAVSKIQSLEKEKSDLNIPELNNSEIESLSISPEETIPEISSALKNAEEKSNKLVIADKNRATAQTNLNEAHEASQESEIAYRKLLAEKNALTDLLENDYENSESPLIDEVSVMEGYEAALAAALGEDLQVSGDTKYPSNWRIIEPKTNPSLPDGAEPLGNFVKVPSAVELRLSQIGLVEDQRGKDLSQQLQQGQRIVSKKGTLWRWDGFTKAPESNLQQTARLVQRNRLKELTSEESSLKQSSETSLQILEKIKADTSKSYSAESEARINSRQADEALNLARETHSIAIQNAVAQNERAVAQKENSIARLSAINEELNSWRKRKDSANQQLDRLTERLKTEKEELEELKLKPAQLEEFRSSLLSKIQEADIQKSKGADLLAEAESHLSEANKVSKDSELAENQIRENRIRTESRLLSAKERRDDLSQRILDQLDASPDEMRQIAQLKQDSLIPEQEDIEAKLMRLKKERENMGAVNLLAASEAEDLQEQLNRIALEKEDLEGAIRKLRSGIGSLNREGRERMIAAFSSADENFQKLFSKLFGGGKAYLKLVDSEDPLEAGLEIYASPPGKRLQALSLLSGGEQALTAIALRFAVFLTNPAPICVLDEVDAPLDDANVSRFCDLIQEMASQTETRFLLITHHPQTMARVDRLFGVTMSEQGVSQLVSVDLSRAEALREAS